MEMNINSNVGEELKIYKQIYNLSIIKHENKIKKEFFEYCKNSNLFLILIIYDKEGKIYLQENGLDQFRLVGERIKKEEKDIRTSVKRIIYNVYNTIKIDELEPIALLENKFIYNNEETIHNGIGIMVRVDNIPKDIEKYFYKVTDSLLECIGAFSNRELVRIYNERYEKMQKDINSNFQDEEIQTNLKYRKRYKFHNKIVKRFILTPKIKKKEKLINIMKEKSINAKNMLDVSCGDNSLLFNLMNNNIEYLIANDISWSQIELIPPREKVYFSVHNAITFPFKDKAFDFVYCSNTLHHMPSKENLNNLLTSMLRVGKKIVIYEIEDPKFTKGLPYFLNKYYYRGFLKDVGEQYLCFNDFKRVINEAYEGKADIKISNFKNIQGNYMIAEITNLQND